MEDGDGGDPDAFEERSTEQRSGAAVLVILLAALAGAGLLLLTIFRLIAD